MAQLEPLLLYTDGASRGNPGRAAISFRILGPDRAILREHGEAIGLATNNEAEYRALIAGLDALAGITSGPLRCLSDSEVMVKQLRGEYQVKKETLKPLWTAATQRASKFQGLEYVHVPRTDPDIVRADKLANDALDAEAR